MSKLMTVMTTSNSISVNPRLFVGVGSGFVTVRPGHPPASLSWSVLGSKRGFTPWLRQRHLNFVSGTATPSNLDLDFTLLRPSFQTVDGPMAGE